MFNNLKLSIVVTIEVFIDILADVTADITVKTITSRLEYCFRGLNTN